MRILLNLLPQPIIRQREARARRRTLLGIPLLGIVVLVLLYLLLVTQENTARRDALDAEQRLAPLRPAVVRLSQLQSETETFERRRDEIQAVLLQRRQWSELLGDVSRVIPQDAWLQSMVIDPSTMTLSGYALRLRSVGDFTITLPTIPAVAQVQVQSLQQTESGGRRIAQFQIVARLKESRQ